jgi:hypothetical protein
MEVTKMSIENQKIIRLTGILSIIGGLLCAISDLLLGCGGPMSGKEVTLANMALIPYEYTLIGAVLGVAVIPLWLFVLIPLYHALKPAGKWFAIPVILFFAYNIAASTVYHGAYAFYGAGHHALAAAAGDIQTVITEMMNRFMVFRSGLLYITAIPIILGSVWFIIAVLFRTTLYKRWMAIFSPLLAIPAAILCIQLPAPIGGYIVPPSGSIVYTIFFILTTIVTWNIVKENPMK